MIIVTSSSIAGKRVTETIGLVRGSTVRCRHLGKDILAKLRNLVGGEIPEYTKMLAEAREQALDRMMEDARKLGANAIVDMRFGTASISGGMAEIIAYGTAAVVEDLPPAGAI
ncbi:MAG: YbjQ family protein [Candidatus Hydrogenedentes bacterium]|nr:YbjQ family protein [Candidatus Hydrogenedentota bacterium]